MKNTLIYLALLGAILDGDFGVAALLLFSFLCECKCDGNPNHGLS